MLTGTRARASLPLVVVVATALAAVACGDDHGDQDADSAPGLAVEATVGFEPDAEPAALVALEDGGLLVGERCTGRVRRVTAGGDLEPRPVARVAVTAAPDDQRGLLGLATDGARTYAAWTRAADGRIVVAELTGRRPRRPRVLWEGPPSSELANGGHLDLLPDGRLVVGIGDLQDPRRVDDPNTPNGKLLALDPAGPPGQRPRPLTSGWNNPFAFTATRDGALWVADNAPGDEPERIGRGDTQAGGTRPAGPAGPAALPGRRAPAALVELEPGRLGLCGYLDGNLAAVDIDANEPRLGGRLAGGCRTGAAVLSDGRLAVSDGERVRILAAP